MRFIKSILLLLFILALGLFTFQNMETVELSFLIWHVDIPLSLASVSLYILGAISGGLLLSMLRNLSRDDSHRKSS